MEYRKTEKSHQALIDVLSHITKTHIKAMFELSAHDSNTISKMLEGHANLLTTHANTLKASLEDYGNTFKTSLEYHRNLIGVITKNNIEQVEDMYGKEGNRLGKLVESIVHERLRSLLLEIYGVKITHTERRRKINVEIEGKNFFSDIDVWGSGEDAIVAVEVKGSIKKDDVGKFYENILCRMNEIEPTHKGKDIYGGVAFMGTDKGTKEEEIVKIAEGKNLFVMKIINEGCIKNINTDEFNAAPVLV